MNTFLSPKQKNLLGIFGGVGPLSHVQFEKELLAESFRRGARCDQDHPAWVLVSATPTPDRTESLMSGEHTSLPTIEHYAKILENAGADAMFVICNTAHGYHTDLQKKLSIPWVHLMEIVALSIKNDYPDIKKVGILGTNATVQLRLYHDALEKHSLAPIAPKVGSVTQDMIMKAVYDESYGVKATGDTVSERARVDLIASAEWCRANGAEAVIAACTEVSVALTLETYSKLPIIDPLKVAAKVALDVAEGKSSPYEFMVK